MAIRQTDWIYDQSITRKNSLAGKRKDNWWILKIVIALVVILALLFGFKMWQLMQMGKKMQARYADPTFTVKTEVARLSSFDESSDFVGELEAMHSVDLKAIVEGPVRQILVSEGQSVSKGQLLMVISPNTRTAELRSASAALDESISSSVGNRASLMALQKERSAASAQLKFQNNEYQRNLELFEEGVISKQSLEQIETQKVKAQSDLDSIDQNIRASQANLASSTASIRRRRADRDTHRASLADSYIRAPFAGTIGDIRLNPGDYVERGDHLSNITQNNTMDLRLDIPVRYTTSIKKGLPTKIFDPESHQILATGQVIFVSPVVDVNSQTVVAKARFQNQEGTLRDKQLVSARIIWKTKEDIIVLPNSALVSEGSQKFVYLFEPEEKKKGDSKDSDDGNIVYRTERYPIETGKRDEQNIEVLSGIEPGQEVIVSGLQKISDGAKVTRLRDVQKQKEK